MVHAPYRRLAIRRAPYIDLLRVGTIGRSCLVKQVASNDRKVIWSWGRHAKVGHPRIGNEFGYPFYELVTINGIAEVIEHRRMEPIFSVNDDPVIRQELESRTK
jgi:hypothetical protein